MCELTTIALMATSAALSAAGGMISTNAMNTQVKQQNEFQRQMMQRNREMREAALRRDTELRQKQEAELLKNEQNLTGEARQKQMDKATQDVEKNTQDVAKDVQEEVNLVPSLMAAKAANNVVAESDLAKRLALASADSRKRIQTMAKLGAYDLAAGERGMMMDKSAEQINMWNNFRKGNLATTEAGLNLLDGVAKTTTIGPQTNMLAAGQLVGGLGQLVGSATAGGTAQNAIKGFGK